jgi:hypothetical protein
MKVKNVSSLFQNFSVLSCWNLTFHLEEAFGCISGFGTIDISCSYVPVLSYYRKVVEKYSIVQKSLMIGGLDMIHMTMIKMLGSKSWLNSCVLIVD